MNNLLRDCSILLGLPKIMVMHFKDKYKILYKINLLYSIIEHFCKLISCN
jgi:hypothetical protein